MTEKICPRCGKTFICRHNDIVRCQCSTVTLTPHASAYIKQHYQSCLCVHCLKELNDNITETKSE